MHIPFYLYGPPGTAGGNTFSIKAEFLQRDLSKGIGAISWLNI